TARTFPASRSPAHAAEAAAHVSSSKESAVRATARGRGADPRPSPRRPSAIRRPRHARCDMPATLTAARSADKGGSFDETIAPSPHLAKPNGAPSYRTRGTLPSPHLAKPNGAPSYRTRGTLPSPHLAKPNGAPLPAVRFGHISRLLLARHQRPGRRFSHSFGVS